ncbi:hypothetical protein CDD83_9478 [Cordyceps sp. RAO-2017]|nr:hypothetical protein CDD83_9478 [Cordyceps sp. RAO-2017]
MKVLCLGLPRSGTESMAEALTVLGYQDVFHGKKHLENKETWAIVRRANAASFPSLPTYTGRPLRRDEWDELFGSCEAATELAAVFAVQLIEAYPEAKVILTERDFDKWQRSMNTLIDVLWNPAILLFSGRFFEPLMGNFAGTELRNSLLGFFEAGDADEIRRNARRTYDRHHRQGAKAYIKTTLATVARLMLPWLVAVAAVVFWLSRLVR